MKDTEKDVGSAEYVLVPRRASQAMLRRADSMTDLVLGWKSGHDERVRELALAWDLMVEVALAASPAHATGAAMRESLPHRHENKERNKVINRASTDLENIINGHDPEVHHLGNRVWDRLDKMACEIEALSSPAQEGEAAPVRTDADGVREAWNELRTSAKTIYDSFVASEAQGYRSRDRQYAIQLLGTALDDIAALKPEGETGPAVAELRITHGGYGCELKSHVAYALPEGVHKVYAAALTVSPSPSERDQHQGETLTNRLRGMFDMGVPSTDTFNHLTPAGFRLLRAAHDALAALSTPEAVPVADKREGEANG